MARKVWTRDDILAAAGIKPVEWPKGWHLHSEPEPHVSPNPPAMKRRKGR